MMSVDMRCSSMRMLSVVVMAVMWSVALAGVQVHAGQACPCQARPAAVPCSPQCRDCVVDYTASQYCACSADCKKPCPSGYTSHADGGCGWLWVDPKLWCDITLSYNVLKCGTCRSGFFGGLCDQKCPGSTFTGTPQVATSVCSGAGLCSDGPAGSGVCACNSGFAGPACEFSRAQTCSTRGNPTNNGTCVCDLGYTGTNCQYCATNYFRMSDNSCKYCEASVSCAGRGQCVPATATCSCMPVNGLAVYTPPDCKKCLPNFYNWPTCKRCVASDSCSGHGTCDALGSCQCVPPFTGTNCAQCVSGFVGPACQYSRATCSNHGTPQQDGKCACDGGFTGYNCDVANPAIAAIEPQHGSSNGGYQLTITGIGFMSSSSGAAPNVTLVGPLNATVVIPVDAIVSYTFHVIFVQVPVATVSSRPLTVRVTVGALAADGPEFTYDVPSISALLPARVPGVGGVLTLVGSSFGVQSLSDATALVTLNGASLPILSWDSVSGLNASVMIPAGVGSHWNLTLRTCTGDMAWIPFAYEIPVITRWSYPQQPWNWPIQGTTRGQYFISITGANFGHPFMVPVNVPLVTVGDGVCTYGTVTEGGYAQNSLWGVDTIICIVPPGLGKSLPVVVTVAGQSSVLGPDPDPALLFSYIPPVVERITGCTLGVGVVRSCALLGQVVTVWGFSFSSDASLVTVQVGDLGLCTNVTMVDPHVSMTCTLPNATHGANFDLTVTVAGMGSGTLPGSSNLGVHYYTPYISPWSLTVLDARYSGTQIQTMVGTAGGELVEIYVERVEYIHNIQDYIVTYGPLDDLTRYPCAVQSAQFYLVGVPYTAIRCLSAPGVGKGHHFFVQVPPISDGQGGLFPVRSNAHEDELRYPAPIIDPSSLRVGNIQSGGDAVIGTQAQGDQLTFTGANFGPDHGQSLTVTYGPSDNPTRYSCAVVSAQTNNTAITCITALGQGGPYVFQVAVGLGSSAQLVVGTDTFTYPQL